MKFVAAGFRNDGNRSRPVVFRFGIIRLNLKLLDRVDGGRRRQVGAIRKAAPPLPISLKYTPSIVKKLPPQCSEPASFGLDGESDVLPAVIRINRSSVRPFSGSVTTARESMLLATEDDSD